MAFEDAQKTINAFGSVFQWGSGLLGKSAIVMGILEVGIFASAWTVHGDSAKIVLVFSGVLSFFGWYVPFLKFCEKHPADALLEGHHWAAHQQIMASKGQPTLSSTPADGLLFGAMTTNPEQVKNEKKE